MTSNSTIILKEIKNFSKDADHWWQEDGPFKSLHRLNPVRIQFLKTQICNYFGRKERDLKPLINIQILDVGCGGGLITEPLTKLGGFVTGIDPILANIKTAQNHASERNLKITYVQGTIEDLKTEKFDVVLALEIVEHIDQLELFFSKCNEVLDQNGLLILSTLNRNFWSYMGGIIAAEYILKLVPKGTHDWEKFLKPSEVANLVSTVGFQLVYLQGIKFNILKQEWQLNDSININYFAVFKKRKM